MSSFDPYAELQLSPDAEPELVKAAFKALAKKYHPDRYSDPAEKAEAERKMARINEAQRLLQSGEYRPPRSESPRVDSQPTAPPEPPPQTRSTPNPRSTTSTPPSKPKQVPYLPFVIAAALLIGVLVLPGLLSEDHVERALQMEKQGQYQEALSELNQAVRKSPHDRSLYLHRARIWEALGDEAKAAVDRKNGSVPVLSLPSSTPLVNSSPHQVPDKSG